MPPLLRTRLSAMMFLQFATWGAWAPVLGKHLENLGFKPGEIAGVYGTGALAIMISPLIAGQIADRWFATQWFLSLSFLGTGGLFFWAARIQDYPTMWRVSLGAMLLFGPTLGLGNSLSFHHLSDPRGQFPAIRVWGTLGWIGAGLGLTAWMKATGRSIGDCLNLAGAFAVLNGLYCLTLPHTPPKREARDTFALGKVFAMLKDPSFLLFSVLAFLLMVFATFYYFKTANYFPTLGVSDAWLSATTNIGQAAEILTMFALPWVYKKLGSKATIAIGIAAWALRFGVFALGRPVGLVIASQALHGVCFAFAIAAAMIYVERVCEADVRGSAQSFLNWLTYGLGMFAGAYLGGYVGDQFGSDWRLVWSVPAIGCAVVLFVFLAGFRARDGEKSAATPSP